jgi:hypothetical protein
MHRQIKKSKIALKPKIMLRGSDKYENIIHLLLLFLEPWNLTLYTLLNRLTIKYRSLQGKGLNTPAASLQG